jgi:FKBP-type peptidyl-prolyl cis-trans isomerase SlyD
MQIAQNTVVSIDYTLTDADGQVIDSSQGREPLTYVHGSGQLIPGLESALEGQSAGNDVEVKVAPDEAYGERDERLVQAVPRAAFQGVDRVETGMRFQARGDEGQSRLITVTAVEGDTVTIDANHPLAGKPLHFKVSIVEVREADEANEAELESGQNATPGSSEA